jgi:hypothetical protein
VTIQSRFLLSSLLLSITVGFAACSGSGDGSTPTSPEAPAAAALSGTWSGTQTGVSSTSGGLCVHQLISNLIAAGRLSEPLQWKITQFQSTIHVEASVNGKTGGSYEGPVSASNFSGSFKSQYGNLLSPIFCSGTNYVLVETGGAFNGQIGAGILTGTGTRQFAIYNSGLTTLLGQVTETYQFSVRK